MMASWNMGWGDGLQSVCRHCAAAKLEGEAEAARPALAAQEQRIEDGVPAYSGWTKFAAGQIRDNQVWSGSISFGTLEIFYSYEERGAIQDCAKNAMARRIPCVLSRIDAGN